MLRIALTLLAVLALAVAGILYFQQDAGTTGPLPPVDPGIEEPLRSDLEKLQDEVDS